MLVFVGAHKMKGFPDYPFSYAEAVASTKRLRRRLNGSPTSPGDKVLASDTILQIRLVPGTFRIRPRWGPGRTGLGRPPLPIPV